MALIACKEWGNEVSTTAKTCPKCGAKVAKSGGGGWVWGLLAVIAIIVSVIGIGATNPDTQERGTARRAIELCWGDQQRKSLSPSEQRAIAAACEGMEAQFKRRYGVNP